MYTEVDTSKVDSLIELMVEDDVYFAPTLVNFERNFVLRNTPEHDQDPALQYIPEDEPARFGAFDSADRENWRKTVDMMKDVTRQFQKAGGLLIAGTDSPGAALPGWSLHQEMEMFVQAGITPMEALQAATLNNAKVMNKEDDLGTLETGKYADMVILDADPLEDITNTQEIHLVIKDGLVLDPGDLLSQNIEQFGARGERSFDRSKPNQ